VERQALAKPRQTLRQTSIKPNAGAGCQDSALSITNFSICLPYYFWFLQEQIKDIIIIATLDPWHQLAGQDRGQWILALASLAASFAITSGLRKSFATS
jgi:hypothetical protein